MDMTHYMELLATNQPWNLLIFMAVPVFLAETVAIAELYLLYTRAKGGVVAGISRAAGILGGVYFLGVFVHLMQTAVVPLTREMAWRGPFDVIAVGSYLLCVVPLVGIALLDARVAMRTADAHARMKVHAALLAVFLVLAHVAMVFGMLSPGLLTGMGMEMHGM